MIDNENHRQKEEKQLRELNKLELFSDLINFHMLEVETALKYFKEVKSLDDLAEVTTSNINSINKTKEELINVWKENLDIITDINKIRDILELEHLDFKE